MEPLDYWLERELELNKAHEDILTRREALLKRSEWHLDESAAKNSHLAESWTRAKKRNHVLLQKLEKAEENLKRGAKSGASRNFTELEVSYWNMVEKELPAWKMDVKKSKGKTLTPR
ncbi:uncharacterized protein C3orf14 homolog isoform X2 [Anneissia japonica]|uniref:uncharacterized protein C3orf14 homolog isoform X2 n=1 Tax=Anneissia japonica TaxID=1529436 RepID=UPI0014255E72|nr:uncharacterized protein C3orf14 homolog isoform X2 [Anneissia japonica]XP_033102773.1 uncharacterized protein C3orf14 homolog isoform X2 [Anneissia japonica]